MEGVYAEVEGQREALERELAEIELLLEQVRSEAERHETRRKQFTARVQALESDRSASAADVAEPHAQLITLTKRAGLMEAQLEVLEGKRKTLARFRDFLAELAPRLREVGAWEGGGAGPQAARDALTAQEEMRREIARQMHDGPAQSIANIALQANVAQRVLETDPKRGQHELEQLVRVVERALDATKRFIFDVRPMVLDDLGLVPTLRRAAVERSQRAGVAADFESVGQERRLSEELESGLFRIADDALGAFIAAGAPDVSVRLEWRVEEVRLSVRAGTDGRRGADDQRIVRLHRDEQPARSLTAGRERLRDDRGRPAGAASERENGGALPESTAGVLRARAALSGIAVEVDEDRRAVRAVARTPL